MLELFDIDHHHHHARPLLAAQVIGAAYATSVGFPKTVQAAKSTKVTTQKGCTSSIEAVYEDATGKTGLVVRRLELHV